MRSHILQRALEQTRHFVTATGKMLSVSGSATARTHTGEERTAAPVTLFALSHRVAMHRSEVVHLFRS